MAICSLIKDQRRRLVVLQVFIRLISLWRFFRAVWLEIARKIVTYVICFPFNGNYHLFMMKKNELHHTNWSFGELLQAPMIRISISVRTHHDALCIYSCVDRRPSHNMVDHSFACMHAFGNWKINPKWTQWNMQMHNGQNMWCPRGCLWHFITKYNWQTAANSFANYAD